VVHPLRLYLEAGIGLPEALRRLAGRVPSRLQPMISGLARDTGAGLSLKDALDAWKDRLPPEVPALLAAGEDSGRLPEILERLELHFHQEKEAARRLTGALAWPIVQALLAMGILGLVLIVQGLTGTAGRVPGFGLSSLLPFGVLIGMAVAVAVGWRRLPGVAHGRVALARARLGGTLGVAFDSGLSPGKALELAVEAADHPSWAGRLAEAKRQLRAGKSLRVVLADWPDLASEFLVAVDHGETTGQLPETLSRQAVVDREDGQNLIIRTLGVLAAGLWALSAAAIAYTVFRMYAGYLSLLNI
jgi:type II secretory pathway component PulF